MKVTRQELDNLFVALGAKAAPKWPEKRLRAKIAELPEKDLPITHGRDTEILNSLLEAIEDETIDDLEIISGGDEGEEKEDRKAPEKKGGVPKNKNKAMKAAKAAAEGKSASNGDKPLKSKKEKTAKAPKEKKPGVIATIIEILSNASSSHPVTKETIAHKLAKAFPDRDAEGMAKTVNVQVPTRLGSDKGLVVQKNAEGYWISNKA